MMRYELNDSEWTAIKPMLPNKARGVRRVNDRRVLRAEPRRAVLQQDQAVSACRYRHDKLAASYLAFIKLEFGCALMSPRPSKID